MAIRCPCNMSRYLVDNASRYTALHFFASVITLVLTGFTALAPSLPLFLPVAITWHPSSRYSILPRRFRYYSVDKWCSVLEVHPESGTLSFRDRCSGVLKFNHQTKEGDDRTASIKKPTVGAAGFQLSNDSLVIKFNKSTIARHTP